MTGPRDIRPDLEPAVGDDEAAGLQRVADRLGRERPEPAAGFRDRLRATLADPVVPAPAHLRRWVAGCAASGGLLLLVAAAGLVGAGPFAP